MFGIRQEGILAAIAGVTVSDGTGHLELIAVHPDFRRKGLGIRLLSEIEGCFPDKRYELFTSTRSKNNIRLYESLGYRVFDTKRIDDELMFVYLEKTSWEEGEEDACGDT